MTAQLFHGNCLDVMPTLAANSIDTILTDPPYGLSFMGKAWDHGVPGTPFWEAALRVAKPGAMLLAFGGTRTYHRLACGIEDAGWEIRDCLMWLYGSGFPKSHDISKAIDKAAGAEREVVGRRKSGLTAGTIANFSGEAEFAVTAPATELAKQWNGWGTALKPAWEPIILAMKPLDGTYANNAELHGVAALNIDGSRIVDSDGSSRWPSNVLLDDEAAAILGRPSRFFYCAKASPAERNAGTSDLPTQQPKRYGKFGGKPTPAPEANHHPTVKPIKLMEYLCRLTSTPTGGTVLDPFMGSGTTGVACKATGRDFVGIELDAEYHRIATSRIESVTSLAA